MIKLQKRSVRIITHSHYRSHTEPLFSKLDILLFGKLVQYRISLTMFKFHHGQVPDSMSSIFQLNSDVHSYNTRRKFALRSFRGNHEFITHFLFKLFIFGTKYLDVLALMYLFLSLRRFLKRIFSLTSCWWDWIYEFFFRFTHFLLLYCTFIHSIFYYSYN